MSLPKKLQAKFRRQKQEPKVSYQLSTADPEEAERRLNQAFDILFEIALKRYQLKRKTV